MALCLTRLPSVASGIKPLLKPTGILALPVATMFFEKDRKGEYRKSKKVSKIKHAKEGLGMIGSELQKLKQEFKDDLQLDSMIPVCHGDYEIVWKFDTTDSVKDWIVTSDTDHDQGKSKAEFVLGQQKKALFRGYIDTEIPKDGVIKSAGYCNIKSPPNMKSFMREKNYDWSDFSHLLMKVRGDGRHYQIVLQMDRYFDFQWNDNYQYPLFTRGGPYWQVAKIPFSKFYLAAKGRIQDAQEAVQLEKVLSLGVTAADGHSGPFQLEIDYIGIMYDESHTQKFAYEMYHTSKYSLS